VPVLGGRAPGRAGGRSKKSLTAAFVPRTAHLAAALAAAAKSPSEGLGHLDETLEKAARADLLETLGAAWSAWAEGEKEPGTVCHRTVSVATCAGRVDVRYPYAPGKGVGKRVVGKLAGDSAPSCPRATPAARRAAAEAGVRLDSYAEAREMLESGRGLAMSATGIRAVVKAAAAKTKEAWLAGTLEVARPVVPRAKPPKGARHVGRTLGVFADGTGAPCVRSDTEGVAGKDGGEAGTREIKVGAVAEWEYVDPEGRPILREGDVWYFATEGPREELQGALHQLAARRGLGAVRRVQLVGDGAAWVQKIWEERFRNSGAIRTLDIFHALEYLHTVVETLAPPGEADAAFKRFRRRLKLWGGESTLRGLAETFGGPALATLDGEAGKALAYLRERVGMMDYRRLRREGYCIGSGLVESACKTLVAARCKLAGMHWRHRNAAAVALLRGTLRSNFRIAA